MSKSIFTLALVSAIKRKQTKEVLVELLKMNGKEEEAKMVHGASRFTNALIDRTVKTSIAHLTEEEEEAIEEAVEKEGNKKSKKSKKDEGDVKEMLPTMQTAEDNELIAIHEDIENLIKKGKRKKAIKLIKASMENGTKGSVIKEQLKRAKALEK